MERLVVNNKTTLKQAYQKLKGQTHIAGDSETSGLDNHQVKIWSFQFAVPGFSCLIDWTKIQDLGKISDLLMDESVMKIIHNAKFDLKILWSAGFDARNLYCTAVIEKIINAGLYADNSLAGSLKRRMGIVMSKDARKDFYTSDDGKSVYDKDGVHTGKLTVFEESGCVWTPELVDYALSDVEHLIELQKIQDGILADKDLLDVAYGIELPLVRCTALMEHRGIKMDKERTIKYQQTMKVEAARLKTTVDTVLDQSYKIRANEIYRKNIKIWDDWYSRIARIKQDEKSLRKDLQKILDNKVIEAKENWKNDYFDREWYGKFPDLNPFSTRLPIAAKKYKEKLYLEREGIIDELKTQYIAESAGLKSTSKSERDLCYTIQPFTKKPEPPKDINIRSVQQVQMAFDVLGIDVPNLQKATLQDRHGEHPVLDSLIDYKRFEKLSQMSEIYHKINPVTSRIHPDYNQNVDTGRYSCKNPKRILGLSRAIY